MLYGRRCNVLLVINLIEKAAPSERSGQGEIMVIIACVRHQLSVMGMRTQYALGPHNQLKLKALERKSNKRQPRQGTSQT